MECYVKLVNTEKNISVQGLYMLCQAKNVEGPTVHVQDGNIFKTEQLKSDHLLNSEEWWPHMNTGHGPHLEFADRCSRGSK